MTNCIELSSYTTAVVTITTIPKRYEGPVFKEYFNESKQQGLYGCKQPPHLYAGWQE